MYLSDEEKLFSPTFFYDGVVGTCIRHEKSMLGAVCVGVCVCVCVCVRARACVRVCVRALFRWESGDECFCSVRGNDAIDYQHHPFRRIDTP